MSAAPVANEPMRLLLDVSVWIALLDDAHAHNAQALALFQSPDLRIATFDHRVALSAVRGAQTQHLHLL